MLWASPEELMLQERYLRRLGAMRENVAIALPLKNKLLDARKIWDEAEGKWACNRRSQIAPLAKRP